MTPSGTHNPLVDLIYAEARDDDIVVLGIVYFAIAAIPTREILDESRRSGVTNRAHDRWIGLLSLRPLTLAVTLALRTGFGDDDETDVVVVDLF